MYGDRAAATLRSRKAAKRLHFNELGNWKMGAYRKTVSRQLADLDQALAAALAPHQDASERLCEIPGVSVRIAQHIIAETGPSAEVFESAGKLASWVAIS